VELVHALFQSKVSAAAAVAIESIKTAMPVPGIGKVKARASVAPVATYSALDGFMLLLLAGLSAICTLTSISLRRVGYHHLPTPSQYLHNAGALRGLLRQ
jgi:hypothetical protein